MAVVRHAPSLRYPLLIATALAAVSLAFHHGPLWNDHLTSLAPVSRADQQLDQQMRGDLGAPDVRYLVVVNAAEEEAALRAAESVAAVLRNASRAGRLAGYDSPANYLPSREAQRARQEALPAPADLRRNLQQALKGLSYRPEAFEPFLKDATAARAQPLVDRGSLQDTHLALKVDTLLVRRGSGWAAMLPLRGVTDAAGIAREIGALSGARAVLLDLKGESDRLYGDYRREALTYSLLGAAAIVALLFLGLRSARRVLDVLAPLAAAVVITTGVLAAAGQLSIFHLVGLLLVVAVGSNYSLFFDRQNLSGPDRERTVVSVVFACVTTIIGFGLLSFSSVPVLNAIGSTVGIGAALALASSAILSRSAGPIRGRHP
jgi:predicted exporter